MDKNYLFRLLPSVDAVLAILTGQSEHALPESTTKQFKSLPRELIRLAVVEYLDKKRLQIKKGEIAEAFTLEKMLPSLARFVQLNTQPHFRRVLNATGVVIHTNLGRSILAQEAAEAAYTACMHYSNLEFNLETGERGSRYAHVEALLCQLTGAEAALVVNNNAAAVLLVLGSLCKGKEVVVSRGELVEIGGKFRIPEVMQHSGCTLREVGATNRTHAKDYAQGINENTAALMKVHTSNFRMQGFVKSIAREEMCHIARENGLLCIEDLGSGCLFDFTKAGVAYSAHEPLVQEVVQSGMDVITLSGDKVLGGPQAGIILGKKDLVNDMKNNQLTRALRIDKITLAALEATLRLYIDPQTAKERIPTISMMLSTRIELAKKAKTLLTLIKKDFAKHKLEGATLALKEGMSRVGGGSFPEEDLPTVLVAVQVENIPQLRENLLKLELPLVGRVEDNTLCLDPRTLTKEEFPLVANALVQAMRL